MTRTLVVDPGMSSGIVLAEYTATEPFKILGQWQLMEGGLPQFSDWVSNTLSIPGLDVVVCEKFSPLPRVFKLRELEPIRIEGFLYARCNGPNHSPVPIVWQTPSAMLIAGTNNGGSTRAQKQAANKKAGDDMLRALGLWTTGKKDFGTKDANDANAAMKHLIAYFRSIGHGPSLEVINRV